MSDAQPAVILVADDQEGQLVLVDRLLSIEGYEIVTVQDGREALEWLSKNTPDAAVLDVQMPFVDGIEVCRRIKAVRRLKHVPVAILTGMRDEGKLESARIAGADAIVRKPLEGKDFRATVRKLVAAGRERRPD
jgi:CheY-like chemotaxis protein